MTVNSSANSVILILFAFSDNLSAENSKSSADFYIQRIQLLECMNKAGRKLFEGKIVRRYIFGKLGVHSIQISALYFKDLC